MSASGSVSDSTNSTASAPWTSPGAGITSGYDGQSESLRIFIVLFVGLAIYNCLELIFMIFFTFNRRHGLYFWSLLITSCGIPLYSLGFLLKFMNYTSGNLRWIAIVFLTLGWYPMITGESLVLWSRLHLIVSGERGQNIIRYTKYMIILNAIILHIPTTVLTFGANSDTRTHVFEQGYNIMEKIQMIGFFLQEVILSAIYIFETAKILKGSLKPHTRKTMNQLIFINVVIIVMDLALLGLECASLYILETLLKGVIYSVKLKLEFAILGKLVKFVGGERQETCVDGEVGKNNSIAFLTVDKEGEPSSSDDSRGGSGATDVSDFVDLARVKTDVTHASAEVGSERGMVERRRQGSKQRGVVGEVWDLERFRHVDGVGLSALGSREGLGVREGEEEGEEEGSVGGGAVDSGAEDERGEGLRERRGAGEKAGRVLGEV